VCLLIFLACRPPGIALDLIVRSVSPVDLQKRIISSAPLPNLEIVGSGFCAAPKVTLNGAVLPVTATFDKLTVARDELMKVVVFPSNVECADFHSVDVQIDCTGQKPIPPFEHRDGFTYGLKPVVSIQVPVYRSGLEPITFPIESPVHRFSTIGFAFNEFVSAAHSTEDAVRQRLAIDPPIEASVEILSQEFEDLGIRVGGVQIRPTKSLQSDTRYVVSFAAGKDGLRAVNGECIAGNVSGDRVVWSFLTAPASAPAFSLTVEEKEAGKLRLSWQWVPARHFTVRLGTDEKVADETRSFDPEDEYSEVVDIGPLIRCARIETREPVDGEILSSNVACLK